MKLVTVLSGVLVVSGVLFFVLRDSRPLSVLAQTAALKCIRAERKCEPGQVNILGLSESALAEQPPNLRQKNYDEAKLERARLCRDTPVELVEHSINGTEFQFYFRCKSDAKQYYVVFHGSALFLTSNEIDGAEAILPVYSTHWAWCNVGSCPERPSQMFQLVGGG